MRTKPFFITFFTFIFIFSFLIVKNEKVWAANGSDSAAAYSWQCLEIQEKYDGCESGDTNCKDFPSGLAHPDPSNKDHELKIGGTGFPVGVNIYLVACVVTDTFTKCTTGDSGADAALGIEKASQHVFKILGANPRAADTSGSVSAVVRSYYPSKVNHDFFGVYAADAFGGGEGSTITYGTIEFAQAIEKCIGILWDPKGRTFDSKSLEPIEGATVTLLDEGKNRANLTIDTQVQTSADGGFNFYSPAGTYYFEPAKTGYSFPVTINRVHPNYPRAYYCDQDAKNKYEAPIYNKQYPIVEEDKIIHCDVPLDPGTNTPLRRQPNVLTFGQMAVPGALFTQFEGTVTHPFTRILLIGERTGKEYLKIDADKFGNFEKIVENKFLPQDEGLKDPLKNPSVIVKFDLTAGQYVSGKANFFGRLKDLIKSVFNRQVLAQTTKFITRAYAMEPILRFLEGYALDGNGQAIPFATISVKLQMSGKSVYRTTANENGFFSIATKNLPIFEYYLEFTAPNSATPVKLTTSQFAQKNKNYLATNKINLMTVTKDNKPISSITVPQGSTPSANLSATGKPGFIGQQFGEGKGQAPISPAGQNKSGIFILYVVVILLALIILVFIGVFMYLKKKKEQESYLS